MELDLMNKYASNNYGITNDYRRYLPLDIGEIGGEIRILDRDSAIGFLEWLVKVKEAE